MIGGVFTWWPNPDLATDMLPLTDLDSVSRRKGQLSACCSSQIIDFSTRFGLKTSLTVSSHAKSASAAASHNVSQFANFDTDRIVNLNNYLIVSKARVKMHKCILGMHGSPRRAKPWNLSSRSLGRVGARRFIAKRHPALGLAARSFRAS